MNTTSPIPRSTTGPDSPHWSETLRDGSQVLIRPITRHDTEAQRRFIEALSTQARHYRFLGEVRHPSERTIEQLTDIDYVHDAAFAAVTPDGAGERIVGTSRYGTDPDGTRCECAVTVSDDWQNRGLGAVLMKHLIEVARSRGIRTMYSIDLAGNGRMRDLAKFLGFHTRMDPDDASQVLHELVL